MGKQGSFLERLNNGRSLKNWERRVRDADGMSLDELRDHRKLARQLRGKLEAFLYAAEDRLRVPRIGSDAFQRAKGTDWSWRPAMWRWPSSERGVASVDSGAELMPGTTLFHDCQHSEITYRQTRNTKESDLAPYGMRLDVFRFDGSFLSVVLDLPDEAHDGLKKTHLFRMNTIIEMESPLEIFARLNIKHGPNTEQVVRELPLHQDDVFVEFDLGYTRINEKRVEKVWLDLIFEGPDHNAVTLRDVTLSRTRRAEL